jgi:pimeloyl-[acyl-carrier protein] methyl ester esterase
VRDLAGLAAAVFPRVPRGAAVLGWSLGGMLALELARRHPRHLRALALVATTPRFLAGPDWDHGMQPGVLAEFAAGLAQDYRRTVQNFLSLQTRGDENALETLRQLRARLSSHGEPDPAALAAGLAILRDADLREDLARIALPALVIAGEHDRLTPPGAGRELAMRLPSARFVLVPRCGHAPFLSHPGPVSAEVRGFLARHPAGEAS